MARLEHANIVHVYSETLDQAHGLRLLCMQFVPGATIQQILREIRRVERPDGVTILQIIDRRAARPAVLDPGKLRDRECLAGCRLDEAVCWIGKQLAEALVYAHGRKVLHLDVKPANIILNQYGQPMLTDFSLSSSSDGSREVGAAILGGTLGYMAPEHLRALCEPGAENGRCVGERSDIYSLGAVLFDLITYDRLETAPAAVSIRTAATLEDPQRAPHYVAQALRQHQVPLAIARIIERCLKPDADERYTDAGQLARALSSGFDALRIERNLPLKGWPARVATEWPILSIMVLTLAPNLGASALNIIYNATVVIQDIDGRQQAAFYAVVFWYNAIIVCIMAILVERTLFATARQWWAFKTVEHDGPPSSNQLRLGVLRLPFWATHLNTIGWIPFVVIIPLSMELLAGPISRGVLLQISLAFFVTGLIAVVYNYYVVAFVVLRGMYPHVWDGEERVYEKASAELATVPRRNRTFQIVAGFTPLFAAVILIVVGPEQFTPESFDRFRRVIAVLIVAGIGAFWLATTTTGILNECVRLFTGGRK